MIGDVIGNFKVVKRLGSGGMGEVFLAEHKDLQTPVAVKLLNRDISNNTDHVQRFFNEARIVSKIKSAGTVKIFDSGFHDGQAYLIMELLDGESLASRISSRGAMPVDQVIEISRQITGVLDATHRQGVIHRDLKPDNIFIVHDDERESGERVKILDFGIAKLSGTLAMASPKTSGTMGTPTYMAPEQWGDSSLIDWRADAYSLGCVMFEMLCGNPPFMASNIAEAFVKHATGVPPTPSTVVAGVPPELDALILRLLAKEPAERCVSMGQVTRELAELSGEAPRGQFGRATSQPGLTSTPAAGIQKIDPRPHPSSHPVASPLRTQPSSHPVASPMSAATTLGGSAAEVQTPPPRKRSLALVGGIGMAVMAIVTVVIVISVNKSGDSPSVAPASQPEAMPAMAPVTAPPAATAPAPPPNEAAAPIAPPPPVPVAPTETKPAEVHATAPPVEVKPATVEVKKRKTSTASSKTATAATAQTGKTTTSATTTSTRTTTPTTTPTKTPTTTEPATKPTDAGAGSGSATTGRRRFGGGRL